MAMGKTDSSEKAQVKSKKKEKDVLPTKIVIRRLPPTITEEKLKEQLSELPEYNYFRFVGPDYSLLPHVFSRAYISFKTFEDVLQFRNDYDGYIFSEGNGNEYSAVVELSSYQGIPRDSKKKKDPKCGTILKDPDYETFLETLDKKIEPLPSAEIYIEAMEAKNAKNSAGKLQTPLVEFLNKKRALRNASRQNAAAMLENDRKLKREKENAKDLLKGSKMDRKSVVKDGRKEKTDSMKISNDRKSNEIRRKDDRRDRKGTSGRKGRSERDARDSKNQRKDAADRPLSARSDLSRHGEEKSSKRDDQRFKDDKWDERKSRTDKRDDCRPKRFEDQKKSTRADAVKEEEQRTRRKSIEYEDPSIVAFGKTFDSTKDNDAKKQGGKVEGKDGFDDRGKSREADREKERNRMHVDDKGTKNRDRPALAVYRPPVARQPRGKGKDEKTSPEKSRIKSPDITKPSDKKERVPDRGYGRDRPRSRPRDSDVEKAKNTDRERRNKEEERRNMDRGEREAKNDKERY